jgi:DNA-binding NarL/FixJ family response regulator
LTIRDRHPMVGVLVLSQFLEPDYALRLLGAGVDRTGYLLKDRLGDSMELLDAARRVASGGPPSTRPSSRSLSVHDGATIG